MNATVSGTLLGTFQSIVRAVIVCNQSATSLDTITVAHQLGVCPDIMQAVLRSVITATSGIAPSMALQSWNASQVIFQSINANGAGANGATVDFIAQLIYSTNR